MCHTSLQWFSALSWSTYGCLKPDNSMKWIERGSTRSTLNGSFLDGAAVQSHWGHPHVKTLPASSFPLLCFLGAGGSSLKHARPSQAGSVNTSACSCCRVSRGRTGCWRTGLNAGVDFLLPAAWRFAVHRSTADATLYFLQTPDSVRCRSSCLFSSSTRWQFSRVEFRNVFGSLFSTCNCVFSCKVLFKSRLSGVFSTDNMMKS